MPGPTFTNLTASGGSTATSFTTASVSPSGDRLTVVSVHAYRSTGSTAPSAPAVTGNGITYSLIHTQDVDTAGTDRATVFVYTGVASTAGAITISFGATTITRCVWVVDQSDTNVVTTNNGVDAVLQHVGVTSGSVSTQSVSYTQLQSGTTMYAVFAHQTNVATTPRASWTEVADVFPVTLASLETQYFTGSDTAASASWGTAARTGGVVLEITAPSGVTGTVAVTETDDTASATGQLGYTGTAAVTQAGDTSSASGSTSGGGGVSIALRSSTSSGGDSFSSSKAVSVPAGAAIGDIAVLTVETWTGSAEPTVTNWGGFTEWTGAHTTMATTSSVGNQSIRKAWKRLTAADTGTYTVTFSATTWNAVDCEMISGALASGDPIDGSPSTATASTGYPSTSVTVTDLSYLSNSAATTQAVTTTAPSGFTEIQDHVTIHTNNRVATGAGTITASGGTVSANGEICVSMVALKPASTGGTTGTIAVTQANQTASATGQLGYSGTASPTQANQTAAASGTVVNPVTGSIAATQSAQTSSASGQLGYSGTASVTQANQTANASGTFATGITGTISATQASQTASATGKLGYTGTGSPSQANQTSAASGTFTAGGSFSGTIAVTQANQTASASGQLGYGGTVAAQQAGNTSAATGTVINPVTGTIAATQASQTANAQGILRYSGTVAVTEARDTSTAAGSVSGPVTGSVSVIQAGQTAVITGQFTALVSLGTAHAATGQVATAAAAVGSAAASSAGSMRVPTATGG